MRLVLALVLLAGCNQLVGFDDGKLRVVDAGGVPDDGPPMVDAPPIDAEPAPDGIPAQCDPLLQTGCNGGEKCTWITLDTANDIGVTACAPDGAVTQGGSCTRGVDGMATGFDDCAAGSYCAGANSTTTGLCERICDTDPDSCGADQRCGQYAVLFNGTGELGLCDFTCDPVTQRRTFDNAAACGSAAPATPDYGCYKYAANPAFCAKVPAAAATLTQGATAYNWPGPVYLNGCAPGFAPLMRASTIPSDPIICMAFCRPAETHSGMQAGVGGVVGSGFTCADRGAAGHNCRFFWFLEAAEATSADNNIGFCMNPANYIADWDDNIATPDTALPSCTALQPIDSDGDSYLDHYELACAPFIP